MTWKSTSGKFPLTSALIMMMTYCGGGSSTCPVAEEGCECTSAGLCNPGLICVGGVCVGETTDTSTDTVVDTAPDVVPDTPAETECTVDGDCDDGDPCTTDTCDEYGDCQHAGVDEDGDGYLAARVGEVECGGDDCIDDLSTAYPGAPMVECSELDNDCNGSADEDNDGDGYVSFDCGGVDCHDNDLATILGECEGEHECCDGCWKRNGCWRDAATEYIWESPTLDVTRNWHEAITYCSALALAGHGTGEWRLPTITELRTLVRGCPATEAGGLCGVTDLCLEISCEHDCGGCTGGGPGMDGCYWPDSIDGLCEWTWSASTCQDDGNLAYTLEFNSAMITPNGKEDNYAIVRCVHAP